MLTHCMQETMGPILAGPNSASSWLAPSASAKQGAHKVLKEIPALLASRWCREKDTRRDLRKSLHRHDKRGYISYSSVDRSTLTSCTSLSPNAPLDPVIRRYLPTRLSHSLPIPPSVPRAWIPLIPMAGAR